MPGHFALFAANESSPGVILPRASISIANAVAELALIGMPATLWNGSADLFGFHFKPQPQSY